MQCFIFVILVNILLCHGVFRKNGISIKNNGYENILISIHEDVAENSQLIHKIKESFTSASTFLYHSTRHRAYFRDITILLPQSWSDNPKYHQAKSEYYNNADITINPFAIDADNSPLVKTYRGCGEPGEYMQMSEHYLLNETYRNMFGPIEKALVHEWAHLRWGVFDEYPETAAKTNVYYSMSSETYEPIRCTRGLQGQIINTKTRKNCTSNEALYNADCEFFPYPKQVKNVRHVTNASIMDHQYVDTIQHFCENSKEITLHKHNVESPSQQNTKCGKRGTWDVIISTADFSNNANPPFDIGADKTKLNPTFKLIRHKRGFNKVVLVLDTSGSMSSENRLTRMVQAVGSFIRNGLTTGTELGVIRFSSSAEILEPLTKLTTAKVRESMVQRLPQQAYGGTSIGAGLSMALNLLKQDGVIILISDGEETESPYIADFKPQIIAAEVVVHCIGFTQNAAISMGSLAADTGGRFEFDQNQATSTSLDGALRTIAGILNTAISNAKPALESFLYSKEYNAGETVTNTTYLNSGLGNKTTLTLSYITAPPTFNISSPSDIFYDSNYVNIDHDVRSKMIILSIPGIAESGRWIIEVTNPASVRQRIATSFASYPSKQGDVFVLNVQSIEIPNTSRPTFIIRADAMKGGKPVIGLNVTVIATRPNSPPVKITLLDNGIIADSKANDGIYSRYFTQLTGRGRYSFSAIAEALPNTSQVVRKQTGHNAAVLLDPMNITDETLSLIERKKEIKTDIINGGISATSSGGALDFNPSPTIENELISGDFFPPSEITDLQILSTDFDKPSIKLQFTAPGDDYDDGTATRYNMMYKNKTSKWMPIDQLNVISGNLTSPKPFGETEQFEIIVPYNKIQNVSFTFKVQAEDDVGQKGPASNLVSAGFGTVPPVVEVTTDPFTLTSTKISREEITTTETFSASFEMTSTEEVVTTTSNSVSTAERKTNTVSTVLEVLTLTTHKRRSLYEQNKHIILSASIAGCLFVLLVVVIAIFLRNRRHNRIYKINILI